MSPIITLLHSEIVCLVHGDSLDFMSEMCNPSIVDLILTDPPHGIGMASWDTLGSSPFQKLYWEAALRILKPGHYLLARGNVRTQHRMVTAIEDAGFEVLGMFARIHAGGMPKAKGRTKDGLEPFCVARKPGGGFIPDMEAGRIPAPDAENYRKKCASVKGLSSSITKTVYGAWTSPRTNSFSAEGRWPSNVLLSEEAAKELGAKANYFYTPRVSVSERGECTHPTMLPLALCEYLIKMYCPPNGVVYDPFMGTGQVGRASIRLGRRFIGVEKEEQYLREAERNVFRKD